ncbi:hypothetical protein MMC30_002184 [Trapelia coarctata]|nr:hypothetical protein [Trapelia coarctata]
MAASGPMPLEEEYVVVIRPLEFIQDLETASAEGDLKKVTELFERSEAMEPPQIDPERRPKYYQFQGALVAAAKHNHPAIASYIMSKGVHRERTAIYAALENNSVEVLQCFLDRGWDPNGGLGHVGGPSVYGRKDTPAVRYLLAHGASPNKLPPLGPTPLEFAVQWNLTSMVDLYLSYGGDLRNSNALHIVTRTSRRGSLEMLGYLLDRGADVNKIEWSHSDSRFNTVEARLNNGDGYGTALHLAARDGDEEKLLFLLSRGADRSVHDTLGRTAWEIAEDSGHDDIVAILCNRDTA